MKDRRVDLSETSSPADGNSITPTLLLRVQSGDAEAWERFVGLFGPVVYGWCRGAGLRREDAADVGQDVFLAVAQHVARFRRARAGDSFRGWLWTITRNKIRDFWRRHADHVQGAGGTTAQQRVLEVADVRSDDSAESAQPPNISSLFRSALEMIRSEFEPRTWQAFWRVVVEDGVPVEVAGELGMSVGAVYIAKSRVLRRLRDELGGFLESRD